MWAGLGGHSLASWAEARCPASVAHPKWKWRQEGSHGAVCGGNKMGGGLRAHLARAWTWAAFGTTSSVSARGWILSSFTRGATEGRSYASLCSLSRGCWGTPGLCAAQAPLGFYEEVDFTSALLRGTRCQPGREFPSGLERDDRQQLHGWCASLGASGPPGARGGCGRARVALGPRPAGSRSGSAGSAQQEEFLGRVVLWSRMNTSRDRCRLFLALQQTCYGHATCPF